MPQPTCSEALVSVCMITYNHAAFIGRAIESILAQKTSFPFELVIGEDFSTDGTREIVLDYANRYPEQIKLTPHTQNVGSQRNEAETEKHCTAKYIAYCEGDDFWHDPLKLQKQVDRLEADPELGLVFSDYDRYYPASHQTVKSYNETTQNIPPSSLDAEDIVIGGNSLYILTCTVMLRRQLLAKILSGDPYLYSRPDLNVRDTSVWAEAAVYSKVGYIPESLSTYTVNTESASKSQKRLRRIAFASEVYDIALHLSKKHKFSESTTHKFQTRFGRAKLKLSIHKNDIAGAEHAWKELPPNERNVSDSILYRLRSTELGRSIGRFLDNKFSRF